MKILTSYRGCAKKKFARKRLEKFSHSVFEERMNHLRHQSMQKGVASKLGFNISRSNMVKTKGDLCNNGYFFNFWKYKLL